MGTMLAACLPGSWLANTAPKRHLFPLSFKRLGISCHWCLGITGMTTMLPLFCLPWELWRWHCVSRVSLIRAVHTPSTAEGNVSRTLQVMVTDSVTGLAENRRGEINEFLKDALSTAFSPSVLCPPLTSYELVSLLIFLSLIPLALGLSFFALISSLPHISLPSSPEFSLPNTSLLTLLQL